MVKPGLKLGLLLGMIVLLPSLFFSAYEIGNLSQNEQIIDSVYSSQLESILFSINQYSDDVLSGWANQLDKGKNDFDIEIENLKDRNLSIDAILLQDSLQFRIFPKEKITEDSLNLLKGTLTQAFVQNVKEIETLKRYLKNDYQKIGVLHSALERKSLFAFARSKDSLSMQTVLLLVDTEKFIQENLGPKIQGIAQDRFFISVFKTSTNKELYSNVIHPEEEKNIQQKRSIWLFPGYELGIQMKGNTIEDLVRKRTQTNIILLIAMDVVLLLGAWFVFKNIRQQIRLTRLKSEFISNVSHEIRTPLALINMYSETLEMGRIASEEKKMEYYKVIKTEANRLSRMVNKMLNFSKIENGKREYHFEKANLNEEIENLLENYRQHIDRKGFEVEFVPDPALPLIKMDREAVSEAILNLLDNAVKYSDEVKRIEIKTKSDSDFVLVEVIDHGIGIATKDQALVFDKFFRVTSGNLAHKAKGSGIGLSIVKHIMDAHFGKVELKSTLGKGSCFSLHFPIK